MRTFALDSAVAMSSVGRPRMPFASRSLVRFTITVLVAIVTASTGRSQEASPLRTRAIELLKRFQTVRSAEEMSTLRDEYLQIADTLEVEKEFDLLAKTLDVAGIFWFRGGDIDKAKAAWLRGLKAARSSGDRKLEGRLLNSLGVGSSAAGDYEGGLERFGELVQLRQEIGDVRGEGVTWGNLSLGYKQLGRIPEALEANQLALECHRKSDNLYGLTASFVERAELLAELGRLREALVWSDSAVARARPLGHPPTLGVSLGNRARYLMALGRTEDALTVVEESGDVLRDSGDQFYLREVSLTLANVLLAEGRQEACLNTLAGVLPALEKRGDEGMVLYAMDLQGVALMQLGRYPAAEDKLLEAIGRFEELRDRQTEEKSQAGLFLQAGDAYADLALCYLRQGRVRDSWLCAERGRAALFRRQLSGEGGPSDVVDLEELQRRLGLQQAALVQFSDSKEDESVLFVIDRDSLRATTVDLSSHIVDDARVAIDLMSSGANEAVCGPPLQRISEAVLTPMLSILPDRVERMLLVPPSQLAGMPFEALPIPRHLQPGSAPETLGDRYPIAYLPSATALTVLEERHAASQGLIAFADPVFSLQASAYEAVPSQLRSLSQAPLPEARLEAEHVAPRGATILLGKAARKSMFFSPQARQTSVLHFATHAFINPVRPERSALLLAGEDEEGAVLTAEEVSRAQLQADLVTLSGCETGGGYTYLGEGTYGLARSFLLAGARSVVTSLWQVEDGPARRFMEFFYEGLRSGLARDLALQAARRVMSAEGYAPRERSAFVLTGVSAQPVQAMLEQGGDTAFERTLAFLLSAAFLILAAAWLGRRVSHNRRMAGRFDGKDKQ